MLPARGGSKGLPGKNIAPLAGKPLLVHSVDQARAVAAVERVVVSTDDPRIARVARCAGASVVHRPADLATDEATSEVALLHALEETVRGDGRDPDYVLFLQVTSPFRRSAQLAAAIEQVQDEKADSLFSASPQVGFLWRARGRELESVTYDYRARRRRQDLEGELLEENGSFYIFKPWVLRNLENRLGGRIACYRMGFLEALQIDDAGDLEMAEWILSGGERGDWPCG